MEHEIPPVGPLLNLRGHRFKPLKWENMTPGQQHMTDSVLSGRRGSMQGPYNVLLRSPELGDLAQKFGAHTRFSAFTAAGRQQRGRVDRRILFPCD